jgi:hypothetical protein
LSRSARAASISASVISAGFFMRLPFKLPARELVPGTKVSSHEVPMLTDSDDSPFPIAAESPICLIGGTRARLRWR